MDKNSMFAKLYQNLKELGDSKLIVGVQQAPGTNFHGQTVSSSTEILKIAYVHEFGYSIEVTPKMRAYLHHNGIHLKKETTHIKIPERSYIRRANAEGKADLNRVQNQLIGKLFSGEMTVEQMLEVLGKQAITEVVANMGVDTVPITQYTLEHRKVNPNQTPLTDTAKLQNQITYRIIKGGEEG